MCDQFSWTDDETEPLLNTTLQYKTEKIARLGVCPKQIRRHLETVLPGRIQKRLAFLVGFLIGSCDKYTILCLLRTNA